jgi:multidrug resistance efflux pump
MSRGGVASVSDKEHAKELLSTAFDQRSYEAAVQQLQAEIRAAQKAPREVRKDLSGEVSGRGNAHAAPAAPGSNNGWSITKVE